MGVCKKMTQDDKGGLGVWNGPQKDYLIYERPLMATMATKAVINIIVQMATGYNR